jgi:hypothetical protein
MVAIVRDREGKDVDGAVVDLSIRTPAGRHAHNLRRGVDAVKLGLRIPSRFLPDPSLPALPAAPPEPPPRTEAPAPAPEPAPPPAPPKLEPPRVTPTRAIPRVTSSDRTIQGAFVYPELTEFLQFLDQTGKTGLLEVTTPHLQGEIEVARGYLVRARVGTELGTRAARQIMREQQGTFRFVPSTAPPGSGSGIKLAALFMDVAREDDETGRTAES